MTILYNNSAAPLRLEWPTDWPNGVTKVTLGIYGTDGATLRAPGPSATIPIATTTTANAVAGDTAIAVTAASTFAVGDVIRLARSAGVFEDVPIQKITGLAFTLGRALRFDYASGSAVLARHCTTAQNTTTVAIWTKGRQVKLVWQPDTATPAHTELDEVRSQEFSIAGLRETFAAAYPDEYRAIEARWDVMVRIVELRVKARMLRWPQRYIDTLVDQKMLEPIMLGEIRYQMLDSGGSAWTDDMMNARKYLDEQWKTFGDQAVWFDTNEDNTEDKENEISFTGSWRPSGRVW